MNGLCAELRKRLGPDAVSDDVAQYAIAGRAPSCVVLPASVAQVSEVMAFAHERGVAVVPAGNGAHLSIGAPPTRYDLALSTVRMNRVVAHEAADMTVTVEAGCTLADLNTALASERQWLPLDPPRSQQATIGAVIAADLNGPLRLSQGKVRDLLIGITVVLADGAVAKGGGRVVKNVAGYDVCKLFAGSLGTLGVIVEATFKIRPRPEHTRVLWVNASDLKGAAELGLALLDTAIAPLFVEVVDGDAAMEAGLTGAAVVIGLGGSAEEIEAQHGVLARACGDAVRVCDENEALRLMQWLGDFPAQQSAMLTARISLLPTELVALLPRIGPEAKARDLKVALAAHAGNGVARVRVSGDGETPVVLFAEWLRIAARERGGWVTYDSLPASLHGRIDPFGNPSPAVLLMRGIKQHLDPKGILSPGRFVGGI